jgi:hypothetical protein
VIELLKGTVPQSVSGLTLYRIHAESLQGCETVTFSGGSSAVDTVLRRAAISGRVEIGGRLENHFADLIDANGDIIEVVALDAKSYGALKNHWMRCRVMRDS